MGYLTAQLKNPLHNQFSGSPHDLLVFQKDPGDSNRVSKRKYAIGFICTLAASAANAMMLCLTQLAFQKIIKRETIRAIIDMTIYENVVASLATLIGLFASGDWLNLNAEMQVFKSGKVSYVMTNGGSRIKF
ncbi:hypothetical protein ACS0TY_025043 [Phlomoides rotata]